MELNELANKMSSLALSINDVSYDKLRQLTNLNVTFAPNNNVNVNLSSYKNVLFSEYFYYKAFLVSFYAHTVFSSHLQMDEMNKLVELYMEKLRMDFNNNKTGFGNNFDTLANRYNAYFDIALKYLNSNKNKVFMADEMNLLFTSYLGMNRDSTLFAKTLLSDTVFTPLHQYVRTEVNKFDGGNSKCFVATATYQDAMHPNVVLLRDYRDRVLKKSVIGRAFISFYYKAGPYLAYLPEHFLQIRSLSKWLIDKIVLAIKKKYY